MNPKNHSEPSELFFISKNEEGVRLDKVLADRFQEVRSRSYFQMLIENHRVLVNGELVKKRMKFIEGDEVELFFLLSPEITIIPEPIPLDIIFEDESLLVVNKPAGMVVHPAPGNWTGTFVNALMYHCKDLFHQKEFSSSIHSPRLRPGIVHRLDKDTTGLLIAAKNDRSQQKLIEMFSRREIYKEYLAICLGNPGNLTLNFPIGRHPIRRKEMAVIEDGRESITHCHTLSFKNHISLVQLILETGRTHQIRVHLKHHRTPIIGDQVYGNKKVNAKYNAKRQFLHAKKLSLTHPITGKKIECVAPVPQDMQQLIDQFKLG